MMQNLKLFLKKLKFQVYTLSILVETRIIQAFSVEYCSPDRLVNQQTVMMTFVYSYLEQLLHSQNNLVLNLTWRGRVFLTAKES